MEQTANNIPPRYALSLGDLREWHVLEVRCFACGYEGEISAKRLRRRWPEHTKVKDLERRFRCTHCGNRENNTWRVFKLPRNV